MHKVVNQYNAFKLNEYNGTFEIVSGDVDNNGKFWMNWTIASEYDSDVGHSVPVKKDDDSYRNVPIKVVLGDRQEAIENLKWLLGKLEGHDSKEPESPGPGPGPEPPLSDDVPF
jgi:accessory colonization factor AcfC